MALLLASHPLRSPSVILLLQKISQPIEAFSPHDSLSFYSERVSMIRARYAAKKNGLSYPEENSRAQ